MITNAALPGFLLAISLIAAIGAQNAFVLRQGIRREHVFAICLTCALSDAILITLGVTGFGVIMERAPWVQPLFLYGGVAFLLAYGARSFLAAWRGGAALEPEGQGGALVPVLLTTLALTWLNPHVYLDTVILLGSISTQYEGQKLAFALGAISGSFVFFFSLGYGARMLRPLFAKPGAWRVLDVFVGCVMWAIAAKLVVSA